MSSPQQISDIKTWLGSGSINFFGRPYSGKDSQGERLTSEIGGHLLGGGAILRASVIPPHVQEKMESGALIDSDDYVSIVLPFLSGEDFAGKPLILSAVGRFSGEEPSVIAALEAAGHPLKAVISLVSDESISIERWHARHDVNDRLGRADDTEYAVLETRLAEYREKTEPVIEFYREKGLLIEIDATKSREQVTDDILAQLALRSTSEQ
jgi:adenylate kinase